MNAMGEFLNERKKEKVKGREGKGVVVRLSSSPKGRPFESPFLRQPLA
jgi:hypothetical protein